MQFLDTDLASGDSGALAFFEALAARYNNALGAQDVDPKVDTTGDIGAGGANWTKLTSTQAIVTAASGDWILALPNFYVIGGTAVSLRWRPAIYKNGALVRGIGTSTYGEAAWFCNNDGVDRLIGAASLFQLNSSDIHTDNTVTVYLEAKTGSATTRTVRANTDLELAWRVVNLGPALL